MNLFINIFRVIITWNSMDPFFTHLFPLSLLLFFLSFLSTSPYSFYPSSSISISSPFSSHNIPFCSSFFFSHLSSLLFICLFFFPISLSPFTSYFFPSFLFFILFFFSFSPSFPLPLSIHYFSLSLFLFYHSALYNASPLHLFSTPALSSHSFFFFSSHNPFSLSLPSLIFPTPFLFSLKTIKISLSFIDWSEQ